MCSEMTDITPEQRAEAVEAIAALPCAGCGSAPSVTSDWAECETSGCPFDGVTIRLTAWEAIHRTMAPIAGGPVVTDGYTHSWWPYDPTKGGNKSAYALYRGSDLRRGFDLLREAIYRNDAQAIQDAWPNCERWLDFVFAEAWRKSDG